MRRELSVQFISEAGVYPRLADRVAETMRGKIRQGELAAGARLPSEEALVRHFRVSRPVIREAKASLRTEDAIATRHVIGASVHGSAERASYPADALSLQSVASLLNVIEVRRAVEAATAALAAAHMEHAVRRVSAAERDFWRGEGGELARGLLQCKRQA